MSEKLFRVGDRVISRIAIPECELLNGIHGLIKSEYVGSGCDLSTGIIYDWGVLFDGHRDTILMSEDEIIIEA